MPHTLGHGRGACATGRNTVSCATKRVHYRKAGVIQMCPKSYMGRHILRDRGKEKVSSSRLGSLAIVHCVLPVQPKTLGG